MGSLRLTGLVAVLLLAVITRGQTQQVTSDSLFVSVAVDQERLTVGDPLMYTVTVVSPPGVAVDWPDRRRTMGPFEVQLFEHDGPYAGSGGQYADTLRYTLAVYSVGIHTIPPMELSYTLQGATKRSSVTDSVTITVVSVIEEEATDIRDLKDPASLPDSIPWYVWAGVAAFLIVLIVFAIYYYKHRGGGSDGIPTVSALGPTRLPHEMAFRDLEQLTRSGLLEKGEIVRHYTTLSEILRRYLSARYQILAMEITTTELVGLLDSQEIKADHRVMITELLHECDLVKFARYFPEQESQNRSIPCVHEIVTVTKMLPDSTTQPESPKASIPKDA